jgi:uncharacterized protein (DUF58 family)
MSMLTKKCHTSLPRDTWAYIGILAVVVVAAMIREINLLFILAGLMLGPLLVSWQVIRSTLSKLQCRRKLPAAVYPGELFAVEITVTNQRKRLDSWALMIRDRFHRVSDVESVKETCPPVVARAFLAHVRVGSTQTTMYRGQLFERGRYDVGPLEISTRVPVGLVCGTITVPQTVNHLLVYPRLGIVHSRWKELVKVERIGQRSSRRHQGQMEGDFFGLRDWRSGDSQRWIHWRTSAKRSSLVVRQFEQSRNQNFVLLLDLHTQDTAAAELAISFVATIVVDHCRRGGGNLIMGIAGRQVRFVRGPASNAVVHEALEVLAEAQTTKKDNLAEIVDKALSSVTTDDRVFLIGAGPLDMRDTKRLKQMGKDRHQRTGLANAVCIDVTDRSFSELFSFEDHNGRTSRPTATEILA